LFRGQENVASTRSTWFDKNAIFLAYKGGDNQSSHGDLDIGSFVLDAQGQRWVCELGAEYYEADGMWEFGKGGGRWKYYRKRAEGNNTLVINPKSTEDQDPYAKAEIYEFKTSLSASYGLIDMTEAYKEDVDEVKRGFALINNRSMVIVQDEIKNTKPAEIYSFFHTRADIEIPDDNKKTAIMTIRNQKMRVDLISPADGQFEVMDAVPLPTSPHPPQAYDNPGVRKLTVHLTNAVNPTISVVFTPLEEGQPEIKLPKLLKLEEWDKFLEGGAYITELTVDSVPIEGFSPYNLYYTLSDGVLGKIEAKAEEGVEVEIIQATEKGGTAFVRTRRPSTGEESVYTISFRERIPESLSQYLQTYSIVGVEASKVPEQNNTPQNTFDKDLSTRWSAEGEQWIQWDLGEAYPIDRVMLAFYNGDVRSTMFSLDVSEDGVHYERVFDGMSSGTTSSLETFAFEPRKVRYIKFNGRGNTVNLWNSITEISVPRAGKDFVDIREHWAKDDIVYLESLGFVKGVTQETFAPDETISIAEFITMAVRIAGKEPSEYQNELEDVKADDWFAGYIQTALSEGLIPEAMLNGNKIRPNEPITREEICSIAVKIYENQTGLKPKTYGLSRFVDQEEVSDYAREYVEKGLTLRLIKGVDDNRLAPKATATRAQASVILKRLFLQIAI